MSVATAARLLIGSRDAIVQVAGNRSWLIAGAPLVLSGGLARHYDQGLAEDWTVLLRGFIVSVVNAFVLFSLGFALSRAGRGSVDPGGRAAMPFWRGYLAFLAVFWMTAPMAWLYAVPYERWMAPEYALACNLLTLAFVSVWRVGLITWALAVLVGVSAWRVLFVVMLFCDVVMLGALMLAPLPPIDMMGGMERSPRDTLLAETAFTVGFFGVLSLPVWFVGTIVAAIKVRSAPLARLAERGPVPWSVVAVAVAMSLVLATLAMFVQRG